MTDAAVAASPGRRIAASALPALGVALIWAFLAIFLVYPLLCVFYDAFSDDTGRLTLQNFVAFAEDSFYRRSLWNSLLLGLGTVAATSVLGPEWRFGNRGRGSISWMREDAVLTFFAGQQAPGPRDPPFCSSFPTSSLAEAAMGLQLRWNLRRSPRSTSRCSG